MSKTFTRETDCAGELDRARALERLREAYTKVRRMVLESRVLIHERHRTKSTALQAKAHLSAAIAIAEAIRERKEVPSGHLYARVTQHMTLDAYNGIISTLKSVGLVKEQNFLLTWVGPNM